jgi:hypothetical protein
VLTDIISDTLVYYIGCSRVVAVAQTREEVGEYMSYCAEKILKLLVGKY